MEWTSLKYLFKPGSIAVAGVSAEVGPFLTLAQRYLKSLMLFGFKGHIYPLHPAGGEIFGVPVYKSILDIPGEVDFVVSAIPARYTPQLVADCAAKGVKVVHLFSSGYSEIEDETGGHLESKVLDLARQHNIRLLGPNCMGVYSPDAGITFAVDYPEQKGFPAKSGPLGLLSQSGGNTIYGIREAYTRGIYFSRAVSYGNAADLNECDFMEYFTTDPNTKLIAMYVEGVKNGQRFIQALKRAVKAKPVIVYKAGLTEIGSRTCASHTSAIAGSAHVWQGMLKQVGAIQVHSMQEVIDVSLALLGMPEPAGKNMVVMGTGGGVGVQAADDIIGAGLDLPMLSLETRKSLKEIYGSEAGNMFRNPVDVSALAGGPVFARAIRTILASDQSDVVVLHFPFDLWAMAYRMEFIWSYVEGIIETCRDAKKPILTVLHMCATGLAKKLAVEVQEKLVEAGLPVYTSFTSAARAVARCLQYYHWVNSGKFK
jgi:acyl-CoA synthetase (NDP forming)